MMPKTFSIKGGGLGEIQKIFVPAHDVTGSGGDRQIDVWFILGIPLICEDVRDFRNDYRSFFERREEAIDKLVRQYRELLPHPWTGHYIADFGQDFRGQTHFNHLPFNEEETRARGALASSGALEKHHAVEYSANLRRIGAHRLFEGLRSW
jgi:hypothetical protein